MRKFVIWLFAAVCPAMLGAAPPQLVPLHATTLSGHELDMAKDDDKVVIINFWATWCAPCRIEMPLLDAAYRRYHGDGLELIAISLDRGTSRSKIADASSDVAFPVARFTEADIPRHDLPRALPETRIYGRDGKLRYVFRAGNTKLDAKTLDRVLPPLLAEP